MKIYLIAYHTQKLRSPGLKSIEENFQTVESVRVATSLRNSDKTTASVILDIGNKKIIKNRFNTDRTFEEWQNYFMKRTAILTS